jgi:hypothetical protein
MLYVRYVHLTKVMHIHKRQTNLLVREDGYIRTMIARVQLQKRKIYSRESQGAWRQDELIGGKPPVVK